MESVESLLRTLSMHEEVARLLAHLEAHDTDTHAHCLRVAHLALRLGRADELDARTLENLAVAAMLHDLGKTALEDRILKKPGPLDVAEREAVRRHPSETVAHLRDLQAFPDACRIAPLHHETGAGDDYPRGGRDRRDERARRQGRERRDEGSEPPPEGRPERRSAEDRRNGASSRRTSPRRRDLEPEVRRAGRILALADRYDALRSARSYKTAIPEDEVRRRLGEEMPDVAPLLDRLPPSGT